MSRASERIELNAHVPLVMFESPHLGLSAVIEGADGSLSYWALVHPPGKPDFHNADCFALELPPMGKP